MIAWHANRKVLATTVRTDGVKTEPKTIKEAKVAVRHHVPSLIAPVAQRIERRFPN